MNNSKLVRWSGWSLGVAGVTQALFWLLVIPIGTFVGAAASLNSLWLPAQVLHTVAAAAGLFGIIGLYAGQGRDPGVLGLSGLFLALLGDAFYLADAIIALVVFPILALNAPALIAADGPMSTSPVYIIFSATFMIGFMLLGVSMLRSAKLPRWATVMLIVGAVLFNLPPFPVLLPALILGGVVWGVGAVGAGVHLASNPVPAG